MLSFLMSSPLEQFKIIPLFSFYLGPIDFSFSNSSLTGLVCIALILLCLEYLKIEKKKRDSFVVGFSLIPNPWQYIIEVLYTNVAKMLDENVGVKGQVFFPFVLTLFFFIMGLNILGLVPYSYTVTSHLIVVLSFALMIFTGVNIICVRKHKLKFFSLFYPEGTALFLGFLLVPIEIISYIFKPVSLAIRLFANMMAGHTLLKVIAGFSWSLATSSGILFIVHFLPLIVLIPLFGLELGVALIQSYVFTLLTCIYINDSVNLH